MCSKRKRFRCIFRAFSLLLELVVLLTQTAFIEGYCTPTWTVYPNTNVPYGVIYELETMEQCKEACINNSNCTGFDWDPGWHCWMAPIDGQWTVSNESCCEFDTLGYITHYSLYRNGNCSGSCEPVWTAHPGERILGGVSNQETSLSACQIACLSEEKCDAVDWIDVIYSCWLTVTDWPWNLGTSPNITHYALDRNVSCNDSSSTTFVQHSTFNTATEEQEHGTSPPHEGRFDRTTMVNLHQHVPYTPDNSRFDTTSEVQQHDAPTPDISRITTTTEIHNSTSTSAISRLPTIAEVQQHVTFTPDVSRLSRPTTFEIQEHSTSTPDISRFNKTIQVGLQHDNSTPDVGRFITTTKIQQSTSAPDVGRFNASLEVQEHDTPTPNVNTFSATPEVQQHGTSLNNISRFNTNIEVQHNTSTPNINTFNRTPEVQQHVTFTPDVSRLGTTTEIQRHSTSTTGVTTLTAMLGSSLNPAANTTNANCSPTWTVYNETNVPYGVLVPVTTVDQCKETCISYDNCLGFDWDPGWHCWLSGDGQRIKSDDMYGAALRGYVTHYSLSRNASCNGTCQPVWTEYPNQMTIGGVSNRQANLSGCKTACLNVRTCTGVDWIEVLYGCWLTIHGWPWNNWMKPDVTHYALKRSTCNDSNVSTTSDVTTAASKATSIPKLSTAELSSPSTVTVAAVSTLKGTPSPEGTTSSINGIFIYNRSDTVTTKTRMSTYLPPTSSPVASANTQQSNVPIVVGVVVGVVGLLFFLISITIYCARFRYSGRVIRRDSTEPMHLDPGISPYLAVNVFDRGQSDSAYDAISTTYENVNATEHSRDQLDTRSSGGYDTISEKENYEKLPDSCVADNPIYSSYQWLQTHL